MSTKTSGPRPALLPEIPEERPRSEGQLQRAQLSPLLCQHKEKQITKGGRVP